MSKRLSVLVDEIRDVARSTDSPYAYQFRYRGDYSEFDSKGVDPTCELVQVYVMQDGKYSLIPCDRAGRPSGTPVDEDDGVAYLHGTKRGVAAVAPQPEPPKPKRRWFRRNR